MSLRSLLGGGSGSGADSTAESNTDQKDTTVTGADNSRGAFMTRTNPLCGEVPNEDWKSAIGKYPFSVEYPPGGAKGGVAPPGSRQGGP